MFLAYSRFRSKQYCLQRCLKMRLVGFPFAFPNYPLPATLRKDEPPIGVDFCSRAGWVAFFAEAK